MRLIEIADLINSVVDGDTLTQESRRLFGAYYLTDGVLAQAGGVQETVADGAVWHVGRAIL